MEIKRFFRSRTPVADSVERDLRAVREVGPNGEFQFAPSPEGVDHLSEGIFVDAFFDQYDRTHMGEKKRTPNSFMNCFYVWKIDTVSRLSQTGDPRMDELASQIREVNYSVLEGYADYYFVCALDVKLKYAEKSEERKRAQEAVERWGSMKRLIFQTREIDKLAGERDR